MAKTRGTGLLMLWTDVDPPYEADFNAMYELEEPSVLRSAAFLDDVRFRPSPWRQKSSGGHVGRNYILNAYRQIFPARTNPVELTMGMSPYLQMGRMDIPDYLTVPGVIRVRRFVVIDGQPKYLTVYEFERPDVPQSAAWNKVRDGNPWTRRIRPHLRLDEGSPAVFRRIYPEEAP